MTSTTAELRVRLLGVGPSTDPRARLYGWLAALAVTAVAGVLRFWRLDRPDELVFDETYYVKQGYSLTRYGYERGALETPPPDQLFTNGTPDVFGSDPAFVVHPPLGKWMIGLGMDIAGTDTGWGWRLAAAVVGTLSVLMVIRIARRLFGSTILGLVAGVLLTFDGHHFVHSRTSLLDVFLMFWALAAFGALVLDREWARERLARAMPAWERSRGADGMSHGLGPALGVRPWRLVAGVCLGLACGVKWSGLFFVVVFGLMVFFWDSGARRAVGLRRWVRAGVVRDGLVSFVAIVPVAAVTYVATWSGWLATSGGYLRQWAAENPGMGPQWLPAALRSLWKYHQDAYGFHVGLASAHPYETNPWSWLVMGRPTSFFYRGLEQGQAGCEVERCSRAVTSLGTPALWWAGVIALMVVAGMWLLRRDWRAGAALSGIAAGYLPWFAYSERTIYTFYAVAFVPWLVFAVTYVIGMAWGPPTASRRRRQVGAAVAGAFVVLVVAQFVYFHPILSARVVPFETWQSRMWLQSWI